MPFQTPPMIVSECVVLDLADRVLLVRRGPPFKGQLALPGGFVEVGETIENACRRVVREGAGICISDLHRFGAYPSPKRDPRGHVASVAFLARVRTVEARAWDGTEAVEWAGGGHHIDLALNHNQILADALRVASQLKGNLSAPT